MKRPAKPKAKPAPAVPELSTRDRLLRDRARSVADKYMPDPKAKEGSGPWAAWALARIDVLEAALAAVVPPEPAARPAAPAPPPAKKLTNKEFAFAQEYIVDLNGTQAAIRAGYAHKTAAQIAYENQRKPHIAAVIADLMAERNRKRKWDAEKVYDQLGEEGDADIADLYDENGRFKNVRDWPPLWRRGLVVGVETKEVWEGTGPDRECIGEVVKVKVVDRLKVKELMGKHVNVQAFKDKVEHDVSTPLKDLYNQIQGIGISPVLPRQVPGIAGANATRPIDPENQGDN